MSSRRSTPRVTIEADNDDNDLEADDYYDDDADYGGDDYVGDDGDDDAEEGEVEGEVDGEVEGEEGEGEEGAEAEGEVEGDVEVEADGEEGAEGAPETPADGTEEAGTPAEGDEGPKETKPGPAKRGRGRPRGRPKGSGRGITQIRGASTGRPRGRGRGRGRAKSANKERAKGIGRFGNRRRDEDGTEEINFGYIPPEQPAPRVLRTIGGGQYYYCEDELEIDEDIRGNQKIDEHGNLLGGRMYKMPTFTSSLRHDREKVYMLSIDAARGAGFKDSLYMFRRNLLLVKLTLEQEEKEKLIAEGKLAANSRSRSVTIVAARNVFKLFGAKVLINGRHVVDDYYEDKARKWCQERRIEPGAICHVEDEAADDEIGGFTTPGPNFGTKFLSRAVGGWSTDIGAALFSPATTYAMKRTLLSQNIHSENWMEVYAREVQGTNEEIMYNKRARMEEAEHLLERALNAGNRSRKKLQQQQLQQQQQQQQQQNDVQMEGVERNGEETSAQTPVEKKVIENPLDNLEQRLKNKKTKDLGRLDPYTNIPHYSVAHQSSISDWDRVTIGPDIKGLDPSKPFVGGSVIGSSAWGLATVSIELDGKTLNSDVEHRRKLSNTPINSSVLDMDITY